MKTTIEARGWIKLSEEDSYLTGCQPDTCMMHSGRDTFSADTVDDLIDQVMSFAGCEDRDSVLLDSCEEPGRLDIQIMETDEGYPATESDLASWRQGHKRLWLTCYTFYAKKVTREAVSLTQKG